MDQGYWLVTIMIEPGSGTQVFNIYSEYYQKVDKLDENSFRVKTSHENCANVIVDENITALNIGGNEVVAEQDYNCAALKSVFPIDFTRDFECAGTITPNISPDGMVVGFVPSNEVNTTVKTGGTLATYEDSTNKSGIFLEFDSFGNGIYLADEGLGARHIALKETEDDNGAHARLLQCNDNLKNMNEAIWPVDGCDYYIENQVDPLDSSNSKLLFTVTVNSMDYTYEYINPTAKFGKDEAYIVMGGVVRRGPAGDHGLGEVGTTAPVIQQTFHRFNYTEQRKGFTEKKGIFVNAYIPCLHEEWEYSANENVITAKCKNPNCEMASGLSIVLDIEEEQTYTSISCIEASVMDGITSVVTGSIISGVMYEGVSETRYAKTPIVPYNVGDYNASIVLTTPEGEKYTANKQFCIMKADLPTVIEGKLLSYTEEEQTLVSVTNPVGTIYYSLDGSTWSTEIPKKAEANTYVIYYYIDGGKNYDSIEKSNAKSVTTTIEKVKPNVSVSGKSDLTYIGETMTLVTASSTDPVSGKTAGTIYYKIGDGAKSDKIPQAKDAGQYEIYYYVDGGDNYENVGSEEDWKGPITVTIGAKAIDAIIQDTTTNYDGHKHFIEVTVQEPASGAKVEYRGPEQSKYSEVNPGFTDVGEYEVSYKITAKNYVTKEGIAKVIINENTFAGTDIKVNEVNTTYDGEQHVFSVEVEGATVTYSNSPDGVYTTTSPSYTDATAPNTKIYYKIDKTGYTTQSGSSDIIIRQKELNVTWGEDTVFVYNGSKQKPVVNVTGAMNDDALGITVDGEETNARDDSYIAEVKITNPNYVIPSDKKTKSFTITPKLIQIEWGNLNLVYNGEVQLPTVKVTSDSICNDDIVQLTVTGAQKDATDTSYVATVTALDNANYKLPDNNLAKDYKILPKEITIVWSNTSLIYNGKIQKPSASAEGIMNGDSVELTVVGGEKNVGKNYSAKVDTISNTNYKLPDQTEKFYEITAKEIEIIWSNTSVVYNGKVQKPTAVPGGVCSGDEVSLTVKAEEKDAGNDYDASVTKISNPNYQLPENHSTKYSIQPKEIGITWGHKTFEYDGKKHKPSAVATKVEEGDTVILTVSGEQKDVATNHIATVTAISNRNYKMPADATTYFSITPKTIGIDWSETSFVYDGKQHKPIARATGVGTGDKIQLVVSGEQTVAGVGYVAKVDSITGADSGNYLLPEDVTTTFEIKKADIIFIPPSPAKTVLKSNSGEPLVEVGTGVVVEGDGTVMYRIGDTGEWTTTVPTTTGLSEGDYKICYKVVGSDNYHGLPENPENYFSFTIKVDHGDVKDQVKFQPARGEIESKIEGAFCDNLSELSIRNIIEEKHVEITLTVKSVEKASTLEITQQIVKQIEAIYKDIDGDLIKKEFLDMAISKEVSANGKLEESLNITDTNSPMEIGIQMDLKGYNPSVLRYHEGSVLKFRRLNSKPTSDFKDGTYYVDTDDKVIYIYSRYFSDFVIVYETGTKAVMFETNGGTPIDSINVMPGTKITIPGTPTKAGYTFKGWYKDAGLTAPFDASIDVITENTVLYAKWMPVASSGISAVPEVVVITISPDSATLTKEGETIIVTATVIPGNAKDADITWISSNPEVAKVDQKGRVTAISSGITTIMATTKNGTKASMTVTVMIEEEESEKKDTDEDTKKNTENEDNKEEKQTTEKEDDKEKKEKKKKNEKEKGTSSDTKKKVTTLKSARNYSRIKAKSIYQTYHAIKVQWTKVMDADGYIIYGSKCNVHGVEYDVSKMKTIKGSDILSWNCKNLEKGTYYKFIVYAYKNVNGKAKIIDRSVTVHATTRGGYYGVAKSVVVSQIGSKVIDSQAGITYVIGEGKRAMIHAKEVAAERPIMPHTALKFESSNKKVAKVESSGRITAVGKGTCKIWVYAQNGVYRTITVTVK